MVDRLLQQQKSARVILEIGERVAPRRRCPENVENLQADRRIDPIRWHSYLIAQQARIFPRQISEIVMEHESRENRVHLLIGELVDIAGGSERHEFVQLHTAQRFFDQGEQSGNADDCRLDIVGVEQPIGYSTETAIDSEI